MKDNEKPYLPSAKAHDRAVFARRSFDVGSDEVTTIFVEASIFTGLRTHSTNSAGNSTLVRRGACRFQVGERERHEIAIEVDRTARVNALVDGEIQGHNLFPRIRFIIIGLVAVFTFSAFVIAYLIIDRIFNA
ncbi:MAG: hypothetical protein ACQ9IQ_13280 [Nitrospirales bacterium]